MEMYYMWTMDWVHKNTLNFFLPTHWAYSISNKKLPFKAWILGKITFRFFNYFVSGWYNSYCFCLAGEKGHMFCVKNLEFKVQETETFKDVTKSRYLLNRMKMSYKGAWRMSQIWEGLQVRRRQQSILAT